MGDLKSTLNPLFLREEDLRQAMELLFFAYRDFIAEPDRILQPLGLGRAHHRVVYFVGRNPGISVSELLAILQITKQSLSRVLGDLISRGYIDQRKGELDRRMRLLELSAAGKELEELLAADQKRRIARAYREAGPDAVDGFRTVLLGVMETNTRAKIRGLDSDGTESGQHHDQATRRGQSDISARFGKKPSR